MGDLRFDRIINLKLICISNFFQAWKLIAKNFPTPTRSKDNSWIRQALFHNSNIVTKIPSQNARGYKMTHLEPIYFGFPKNCFLKICDIYSGGQLKSKEDLSTLINDKYRSDDFTLAEGSHLRLVRAMKFIVGHREKMEGIDLVFPMTFPTLNPNPPKNSSSTLKALASKIEKGSQKYRQILTKNTDFITANRVESWREALDNNNITEEHLRNAFKLAQWKHFDAETRDYILKFLTRKTIFNTQVDRAYTNVKPDWFTDIYCHTCKIELGELVPETCLHAMVTCHMVRTAPTTFLQHLNIAVTTCQGISSSGHMLRSSDQTKSRQLSLFN